MSNMSDLAQRWRALGVPKAAIDRHVSWLSGAPLRQAERDRIRALNQPDPDPEPDWEETGPKQPGRHPNSRLKEMLRAGGSHLSIAVELNLSRRHVAKVARSMGMPKVKPGKGIAFDRQQIVSLLKTGRTQAEVAKLVGCAQTTVGKVARILVGKLALSANRRWEHKRVLTPKQRKLRPLGRRKVVNLRPGVLAS
jgi:hypothetical protein